MLLCMVIVFNLATPQTRKDSVVEQLASQGQGLVIVVFLFACTWGFAFPAFMRFPDIETADFYPIFALLNSWLGVFLFCFMGLGSKKFRDALMGQARRVSQISALHFLPLFT